MQNTRSKSCYTCLSKDRKTWPLKPYSHIYIKLFGKSKSTMLNRSICWECRAVFRKIEQFVNKATYAQSILSRDLKNLKPLSTLRSVKSLKTIKVNHETKLENSEYDEVPIKIDYDTVENGDNFEFDLHLQTTTDCDTANKNDTCESFILDERLIKIERNAQLTEELNANDTTNYYDGSYPEDTDVLNIKDETSYNNYTDYESIKFETDTKSVNTFDSEDEMIMDKRTYRRICIRQRGKLNLSKTKKKAYHKKYVYNDRPLKFEDSYKIVPLTNEEEETWMKKDRMDVTFNSCKYKCELCIMYWTSGDKLREHISSQHRKITEYKCVFCDAYFFNAFTLSLHHNSRHCRLFVCLLCGNEYHNKTCMYDHYDEKHNNTFQCIECPMSFGKVCQVREHYNKMHRRFQCDYCSKIHPTKLKIIKHIRANHQILCKLCNQEFVRRSALDYHHETRHNIKKDETTFCVECNKQYTCVMKYRYHIKYSNIHRIQNGQPLLVARSTCPICKKDYYSKSIMENHYDFVHLKNYKYTCDICNKHFLNNDKLNKHKKIYHLGERPPKNKICHICGRGFEVNKILRNHIRTHTGERPFECPHCPSRFSQAAARYLHIKNVHMKKSTTFSPST